MPSKRERRLRFNRGPTNSCISLVYPLGSMLTISQWLESFLRSWKEKRRKSKRRAKSLQVQLQTKTNLLLFSQRSQFNRPLKKSLLKSPSAVSVGIVSMTTTTLCSRSASAEEEWSSSISSVSRAGSRQRSIVKWTLTTQVSTGDSSNARSASRHYLMCSGTMEGATHSLSYLSYRSTTWSWNLSPLRVNTQGWFTSSIQRRVSSASTSQDCDVKISDISVSRNHC